MHAKQEPVSEIHVDTYDASKLQPRESKSSAVIDVTLAVGYHSH